jgi:hypothetical protein
MVQCEVVLAKQTFGFARRKHEAMGHFNRAALKSKILSVVRWKRTDWNDKKLPDSAAIGASFVIPFGPFRSHPPFVPN